MQEPNAIDGPPLGAGWRFPAPAKLNLFLHVVGRRADGYHELQTLFQFLEFGDDLEFEVLPEPRIERRGGDSSIRPDEDLVVRAAQLLQQAAGIRAGARISLHKRIPVGGGLGGGSSDAATVLQVLNRLWGVHWSDQRLADLGLSLGADVPVFVHGRAAWAEGVGEILIPVELAEPWYLVVSPACGADTATVFGDPALTRDTPRTRIPHFTEGRGRFGNDCEAVVRRLYPAVAEVLDGLGACGHARLSGTGASVFVAFETRAAARSVQAALPAHWRSFVARAANRSPLQATLENWSIGA